MQPLEGPVLPLNPSKNFLAPAKLCAPLASRPSPIKAATVAYESLIADYTCATSVFPAEACEVIGGEACLADIFPEAKLPQVRNEAARVSSAGIDREYLEYNEAKTVFCAEACDALGGEFCGREYRRGVY